MFASVIIDNPSSNVDHEFEYLVPEFAESYLTRGARVKVKFGNSNRMVMGYVIDVYEEARYEGVKKVIDEVLDFLPLINQEQLELAYYIQNTTFSPLSRILNLMIPRALRLKTRKYLSVESIQEIDANLAIAFGGKTIIPISASLKEYETIIKKNIKAGTIKITYDAISTASERKINYYSPVSDYYYANKYDLKSPVEREFMETIISENSSFTLDELMALYAISLYRINKLVKLGYISVKKVVQSRIKRRILPVETFCNNVDEDINRYMESLSRENGPFLWHCADTSEEQNFIANVIQQNKDLQKLTIIIVPDILSSYKNASWISVKTHLGVACLNSRLSDSEAYDYYLRICQNEYPVIVTTVFGALFPFNNVGTIFLLDQENENYRNDQSPRYDMNDVMMKRTELLGAKLIRHSYAPSLKAYSEAMLGHNYLLERNSKNSNNQLISIVDLTEELRRGNSSPISQELVNKMKATIAKNEQVLLILNNRGYSQFVLCRSCGEVIRCPKCNIPLQFQKAKNILSCPACNYKVAFTENCPACGSTSFRHIGFGMEKLKEVVKKYLPSARVAVVDDSRFEEFNDYMEQVEAGEINVIIASDLFSRSVYKNKLGLVGIIALDIVAKAPHYEAHHKAYSLLMNASMEAEQMVIQTYDKSLSLLKYFLLNNYSEYFKDELHVREQLKVEPIYEVNRLLFKGEFKEMFKSASNVRNSLYYLIKNNIVIVGPVYNKREKAVQIIVKHQYNKINEVYSRIYKTFQNSSIIIIIDKNPKYLV